MDIDAKVEEAITAIEAGDFPTALRKLMSAKAMLAGKPDWEKTGYKQTYDRAAIDSLIREVRKENTASQAATFGIQKSNIKYVSTTDEP